MHGATSNIRVLTELSLSMPNIAATSVRLRSLPSGIRLPAITAATKRSRRACVIYGSILMGHSVVMQAGNSRDMWQVRQNENCFAS
jgi:hypothetical protein